MTMQTGTAFTKKTFSKTFHKIVTQLIAWLLKENTSLSLHGFAQNKRIILTFTKLACTKSNTQALN